MWAKGNLQPVGGREEGREGEEALTRRGGICVGGCRLTEGRARQRV